MRNGRCRADDAERVKAENGSPSHAEDGAASRRRGTGCCLHGVHLLLVEDDAMNAEIAELLLRDSGASVTTVRNGQQAVEVFAKNPAGSFDAVLMDVVMPVMDGLTAARKIRALDHPDAAVIPMIAITASVFTDDVEKCFAAGMNAYLPKPVGIRSVIETVVQCFESAEEQSQSGEGTGT